MNCSPIFISLWSISIVALTSSVCFTKADSYPPNILFIISDDVSWAHAGAYGDKVVKTPSFDRIAAEGVLFTNAFCSVPSLSLIHI